MRISYEIVMSNVSKADVDSLQTEQIYCTILFWFFSVSGNHGCLFSFKSPVTEPDKPQLEHYTHCSSQFLSTDMTLCTRQKTTILTNEILADFWQVTTMVCHTLLVRSMWEMCLKASSEPFAGSGRVTCYTIGSHTRCVPFSHLFTELQISAIE